MNIERLTLLADTLEHHRLDIGFNMHTYFLAPSPSLYPSGIYPDLTGRGCLTVACIAGWAAVLSGVQTPDESADIYAMDYLDLDMTTASDLFHPPAYIHWGKVTPQHAAQVIRHLINTGNVDWSIVEL